MKQTVWLDDGRAFETVTSGAIIIPEGGLGFALADDFLPPASLNGLSDAELKADPSLWPFDVFRKHRNHPLNKNVPATVFTLKKSSFTHSVEWLLFWADNLALAWYNVYSIDDLTPSQRTAFNQKWAWLTKGTEVLTNDKSREDGFFDPVLYGYYPDSETNPGARPIGIDALHMERNVFLPVDTIQRRYGGMTGFLFRTFDGTKPPPDIREINYMTHPWFFPRANIIMADEQRDLSGNLVPYLPNGNLGLDPFPHGWDGKLNSHTPLISISVPVSYGSYTMPGGVNLIPANRVHLTDGGLTLITQVPNPYNPTRDLQ